MTNYIEHNSAWEMVDDILSVFLCLAILILKNSFTKHLLNLYSMNYEEVEYQCLLKTLFVHNNTFTLCMLMDELCRKHKTLVIAMYTQQHFHTLYVHGRIVQMAQNNLDNNVVKHWKIQNFCFQLYFKPLRNAPLNYLWGPFFSHYSCK